MKHLIAALLLTSTAAFAKSPDDSCKLSGVEALLYRQCNQSCGATLRRNGGFDEPVAVVLWDRCRDGCINDTMDAAGERLGKRCNSIKKD